LQLTEQSFGAGFYDLKYVYSTNQNNGKILQQLETVSGETTNYTYDSLNRLATASTGVWRQSFTYDAFGNLTDKNVTAGSAPTLHVTVNPANNRISTASYDLNGNLLLPGRHQLRLRSGEPAGEFRHGDHGVLQLRSRQRAHLEKEAGRDAGGVLLRSDGRAAGDVSTGRSNWGIRAKAVVIPG
jgi:YD repeat-containing protein